MATTTQKGAMTATARRRRGQLVIAGVLVALFLILHILSGFKLLSLGNINNLIIQSVSPAFIAWGMMFIFSTGLIDLSVGANIIFSANVGVMFAQYLGWGYPGLIIMTMLSVIILEQITVQCAITLKIPSWVAGLGMALVYEALVNEGLSALPFLKGTNILQLDDYRALGTMPLMAIIWILGLVVVSILFNRTSLSFNMRAVGTNPQVAAAMGINRRKTIMLAAVVGAIFIAIAAIVNVSYTSKYFPAAGLGSLSAIFKPLATVLLAGSFSRFISQPVGIFIGSLVIASVFNVLTLLGVPSGTWQEILLGAIVILCGIISSVNTKGVVK